MPPTTTTVGVRYMIDDVADAIAFYTTHLGCTLQQDATPAFAAVSRDGVRLLLSGPTSSGRRVRRYTITDPGRLALAEARRALRELSDELLS